MHKNKYNTVIFDVDGVILDSVPYHFKAWKKMFENNGVPFTYNDYVTKVNGIPRIAGIKAMMPNANDKMIQNLTDEKQEYFIESVENDPPKPLNGVVPFLQWLIENNISRAAASSSKNAPRLLSLAKIDHYFDTIVSGYDFKKSKPDPEIFLTASKRLSIDPKHCIVIEDAATGVQAGNRGGMTTVGLLHGGDSQIQEHADLTINDLKEHKKIITTFF